MLEKTMGHARTYSISTVSWLIFSAVFLIARGLFAESGRLSLHVEVNEFRLSAAEGRRLVVPQSSHKQVSSYREAV